MAASEIRRRLSKARPRAKTCVMDGGAVVDGGGGGGGSEEG
jgi:hypothetical protein